MEFMNESIRSSAENKKIASSIALQLKILQRMHLPTSIMNEKLECLMEKTARLDETKPTNLGSQPILETINTGATSGGSG